MLLEGEEKDILGFLKVGEEVVKVQGRIAKPFLVSIPEFQIKKGKVSDQDVREHMSKVLEKFIRSTGVKRPAFSEKHAKSVANMPETVIPSLEARFIADVKANPESGIAERYRRLGISVRQGQKIKAELVQKGFIQEEEEHTKTGRIRKIRLTEKGKTALSKALDAGRHPE
jgi:predicted transcriptional regulator